MAEAGQGRGSFVLVQSCAGRVIEMGQSMAAAV